MFSLKSISETYKNITLEDQYLLLKRTPSAMLLMVLYLMQ